jgi:hypothetical protein
MLLGTRACSEWQQRCSTDAHCTGRHLRCTIGTRWSFHFSRRSQNMNINFQNFQAFGGIGAIFTQGQNKHLAVCIAITRLKASPKELGYTSVFSISFLLNIAPDTNHTYRRQDAYIRSPHTRLLVSVIHALSRPVSTTSLPEIKYTSIPLQLDVRSKSISIVCYATFLLSDQYRLLIGPGGLRATYLHPWRTLVY